MVEDLGRRSRTQGLGFGVEDLGNLQSGFQNERALGLKIQDFGFRGYGGRFVKVTRSVPTIKLLNAFGPLFCLWFGLRFEKNLQIEASKQLLRCSVQVSWIYVGLRLLHGAWGS